MENETINFFEDFDLFLLTCEDREFDKNLCGRCNLNDPICTDSRILKRAPIITDKIVADLIEYLTEHQEVTFERPVFTNVIKNIMNMAVKEVDLKKSELYLKVREIFGIC